MGAILVHQNWPLTASEGSMPSNLEPPEQRDTNNLKEMV